MTRIELLENIITDYEEYLCTDSDAKYYPDVREWYEEQIKVAKEWLEELKGKD